MNPFAKAAFAALAVIAIVAGGVYVLSPTSQVAGPSSAPPPSAAPPSAAASSSSATVTIDQGEADGYTIAVPASWNYREYPNGLFFLTPAPITTAAMWVGPSTAGRYAIDVGEAYGGSPYEIAGKDIAELLASTNSTYRSLNSAEGTAERQVAIDGEPAWVTEHAVGGPPNLWIDAVVIHGDRAYNLTMDAAPEHAEELRAAFDEIMASIRWTN